MDYKKVVENIRSKTKDYLVKGNLDAVVIGVSGGIDSALACALIKPVCSELNIPLIGRSISIETNKNEEQVRAKNIGINFCEDFKEVDLSKLYKPMANEMNMLTPHDHILENEVTDWKIRNGNIKARLRMIYLYNLASQNKGLVLSTDNLTEYLLGFWTLHGDVGDFGMIQDLWKTEVYEIAIYLAGNECNVDETHALLACVEGIATDGLGITNSDLDQILPGFTGTSVEGYKQVDDILKKITSGKINDRLSVEEINPVFRRHVNSEFKRQNPYNLERKTII